MINPEEIESNQEFEMKIRSAFQVQDPDQLFIDNLQKKLEERIKSGEQSTVNKPSRWQEKIQIVLSPLAWGMIGLILILTLVWGIKTLIPRNEPVIGSQATSVPVISPAPNVEPTRINEVPIPMGMGIINSENAARVTQLATWGKETISAVAWAPNGRSFAVQAGGKITFYDSQTFTETGELDSGSDAYSLAYSPDGTMLATGFNDGSVKLWDISSGSISQTFIGHKNFIGRIAISPDGNILASAAYEEPPKLWDVSTGQELNTLSGFTTSFEFSPDGTLLATAGSADNTILLWDVASGKVVRRLTGHTSNIGGLAFSPDGTVLASTSSDRTIKLWEVATGNELQTLASQAADNAVAFLPDGETLITVSEGEPIKLWDIASRQVRSIMGEGTEGGAFSLSPSGTMVLYYSIWGGDAIRLLDVITGEELGRLDWQTYVVRSLALSPDGRILAAGLHSGGIKLLDAATGQELRSLTGHTKEVDTYKEVLSLDFSPDGALLASSAMDTTTRLWDVATGEELSTIDGIPEFGWAGGAPSVDFSPDGELLAIAGPSGQIKVWDVLNHVELRTLGRVADGSHAEEVSGVAFSPDGKILASGYQSASITLWDAQSGQELRSLKHDNNGGFSGVSKLEFSPDGQFLAAGYWDGDLVMWDIASGNKLYSLLFPWVNGIKDIDFSLNGDIFAVSSDFSSMALLDVTNGKQLIDLKSPANGVVFSPDGKLLISGSYEGGIKLWGIPPMDASQDRNSSMPPSEEISKTQESTPQPNPLLLGETGCMNNRRITDGTPVYRPEVMITSENVDQIVEQVCWNMSRISSIAYSPDNKIVALGFYSGEIKIVDANNGQVLRTLTGNTGSLAFSPDGSILASGTNDSTNVWDVTTGEELYHFVGIGGSEVGWGRGGRPSVDFSPDGKLLAFAGPNGQVRLWDVRKHVELQPLGEEVDVSSSGSVSAVAFSPEGKILATGYATSDFGGNEYPSHSVILWDRSTGQVILSQKDVNVSSLAFSPDGKTLAVGYWEGKFTLLEVATGRELYTQSYPHLQDEIMSVAYSPAGDILIVWSIQLGSVKLLDSSSGRELTTLPATEPYFLPAFSPDGKLILTVSSSGVSLWGIAP